MGSFSFYEGNDATQEKLGIDVDDQPLQKYNLKEPNKTKIPNDEARSVVLHDVKVGTRLTVCDDPEGSRDDDYCEIKVERKFERKIIGTFEKEFSDEDVRVTYHHVKGLDGKVSHIEVLPPPE